MVLKKKEGPKHQFLKQKEKPLPKDYENIKKNQAELLQKVEAGKTLLLREDEGVKPGGCLVETEIGTIDAQLDTQLSAIKKALGL